MKEEDKKYKQLKFTFTTTYIILLTTASITFIEAIRTPNINVRHVLNLETAISLMAGYFYSVFLEKISTSEKTNIPLKWSDITVLRYSDWLMTTPLMLLVLTMVLSNNVKATIPLSFLLSIVALDYVMLYAGYLGEIGQINRWSACGIGFIAFFGMFGLIYKNFIMPVYNLSNYILFSIYFIVWSLYGVFYMMNDILKNMGLNVLDCIAKCFVGLGLWAYFSKIVVLK